MACTRNNAGWTDRCFSSRDASFGGGTLRVHWWYWNGGLGRYQLIPVIPSCLQRESEVGLWSRRSGECIAAQSFRIGVLLHLVNYFLPWVKWLLSSHYDNTWLGVLLLPISDSLKLTPCTCRQPNDITYSKSVSLY